LKAVRLATTVNTLKSVYSGYNGKLDIKNDSRSAKVEVINRKEYLYDPIPKNVLTDIKVHPKPASNRVSKADLPRATGFNNDQPTEDVSAKLQTALDAAAGISGLTIAQLNLATDGSSAENPRMTPFLIRGQGYFAGVLARAGIWVGRGAWGGFIRNMQLNPHYGARLPQGDQGYPRVALTRFVQSNCSALKFADIKNQTIFNNFVFGSFYGIHFLKDAITGRDPGEGQSYHWGYHK
jgi:hypothetical protein